MSASNGSKGQVATLELLRAATMIEEPMPRLTAQLGQPVLARASVITLGEYVSFLPGRFPEEETWTPEEGTAEERQAAYDAKRKEYLSVPEHRREHTQKWVDFAFSVIVAAGTQLKIGEDWTPPITFADARLLGTDGDVLSRRILERSGIWEVPPKEDKKEQDSAETTEEPASA